MTAETIDITPTVEGYLKTLRFIIENLPAESINAAREYGCIKTLSELGYYEIDSAGVEQFGKLSNPKNDWGGVKLSCLRGGDWLSMAELTRVANHTS